MPRNDPLSSGSPGGKEETEGAREKIRLVHLQLESEEKARQANREFQMQIRKLEVEEDIKVRLRQFELEAQQLATSAVPVPWSTSATSPRLSDSHFVISKHVTFSAYLSGS